MRIGIISDVHGNLPALEAVLTDMSDVEKIVCAGDVVGYNPWPAECVNRIREVASVTVKGNHDRIVHTPERYSHNDMAQRGLEHAKDQLSDEQLAWLDTLPRKTTIGDDQFLLVHDHPEHQDEYVWPAEFPELRPYLDDYEGAIIGHTHIQHEATIDNRLIFNPGSVGQPRDKDPRAAYAVLDTDEPTVSLHRVEYDIDSVISRVEAAGLPPRIGARLLDGE
ncbi:metallophosphoesterase family protein [Halosimplex pelagicum]|uniref:Phosphoesterase n=1 Tax=Halosimplex pelagicum TaxID=869886 RepID=A0A7D5TW58_9EURY|nr:metallophosphoesterase family protein [Halosimplex pelagicum]QLH83754.1 metallophosphoesterase family protein [Halosimplex pelagicum]